MQNYKNELKKNIPKVQSFYDGYLQNFSQKDGSLISKWKVGQELKSPIERKLNDVI